MTACVLRPTTGSSVSPDVTPERLALFACFYSAVCFGEKRKDLASWLVNKANRGVRARVSNKSTWCRKHSNVTPLYVLEFWTTHRTTVATEGKNYLWVIQDPTGSSSNHWLELGQSGSGDSKYV